MKEELKSENRNFLITVLSILCLALSSIVLGLNIHDQPAGRQPNNALSESSQVKYTLKNRLNDHDLLFLSDDNDSIMLSVENAFDPYFEDNNVIFIRRK
jgi:hypothetical protein